MNLTSFKVHEAKTDKTVRRNIQTHYYCQRFQTPSLNN